MPGTRPGMTKGTGGTLILLRILDRLEEILIATLMALATVIIFIAVVHRYLLGVPFLFPILFPINLSWAQELCIYMFVWVAKFGAAYGVRTGIHVGVDLEIPSWFVYLCIPLGSYLMCFRFLQVAWNFFFTGELPHHDHAHVEGVDVEEPGIGAAEVTR
jgi:C4-dicarboxylate transporter DctQ subunit